MGLVFAGAAGAQVETLTFDATGDNEDWVLTNVSSTDIFDGSLPSNEATVTLTIGQRYEIVNLNASLHFFQLLAKGSSFAEDVVLLSQNTTTGTLESDPDINWVDDGQTPTGTVAFTMTQTLADAMVQSGLAPGYRCQQHPTMMRGDIVVVSPPGPEVSGTAGGGFHEVGDTVVLSVSVSGTVGMTTFEWFKDGSATPLADGGNISGAATPALTLSPVTQSDSGSYVLRITDESKGVLNAPAIALSVVPAGALPVGSFFVLAALIALSVALGAIVLRRRHARSGGGAGSI